MSSAQTLVVVHHLDYAQAYSQGALALHCGADGVFFISHNPSTSDDELQGPALDLKESFPEKKVGINYLEKFAFPALERVSALGLDMVWMDNPQVRSDSENGPQALAIADWLSRGHRAAQPVEVFGSVAFKYQPHDPRPELAAIKAHRLGMIPTTSGLGTGKAADVEKIKRMRQGLDSVPAEKTPSLALASGLTCENVSTYLPFVTHLLVATGISRDEHFLDELKLRRFVEIVQGYAG